jgi:hypothetical protein
MSVDLIGLYPELKNEITPCIPDNATAEQFGNCMIMLNNYISSLPGAYITLSDNDWNLILTLLNQINTIKHLKINNISNGVKSADNCEELSKYLLRHINLLEKHNCDRIYMKTGNWYTFDNQPIINKDTLEALNTFTPKFFVTLPKIGKNIVEYHPECSLHVDDLKRFHSFLYHCGGFTINLK